MGVSILIPAFRPTFLRQAIASALAQDVDDFELLVSDDSGGPDLLPIIETFRDPRLRYIRTSGRTGSMENCRGLWNEARFDRVKYLLDDDLMMPCALAEMMAALDAEPEASLAYGPRHVIDEAGRITRPAAPLREAQKVDHRRLAAAAVGNVRNIVGEMSNVLVNRAVGVTYEDVEFYRGHLMRVVNDMGFYLNAAGKGPLMLVPHVVGAFRRHGAQNSSPAFNPTFAAGICEWELFIRGEFQAGTLATEAAVAATRKLATAYTNWSRQHPAIALMQPGLARLESRILGGDRDLFDAEFTADWDGFIAAIQRKPEPAKAG